MPVAMIAHLQATKVLQSSSGTIVSVQVPSDPSKKPEPLTAEEEASIDRPVVTAAIGTAVGIGVAANDAHVQKTANMVLRRGN